MTILNLTASDIEKIIELYRADFADGWTADMLKSAFDGGRFFALGVKENGFLLAVISVTVGYDDADIEGVVVAKNSRGRGIAKALITAVEEKLKKDGKERILLEVRENNVPALSLYQGLGFNKISVRKKYYKDGENALVMEKVIL